MYAHCKVTEKLEVKYEKKIFFTWDPMHKAALADTELRSGKKEHSKRFEWLVEMTTVIGKAGDLVAWGKGWKQFFDICQELQLDPDNVFKMKRPARFSETKFADHAHEVYDKFRNNYKALIILLEEAKAEGRAGSSDQRKRAEKADEVQGKIFNWLFSLCLSMVTDVYKVYRCISCILQKINILPQDKYDCFKSYLDKFRAMLNSLQYDNCPCEILDLTDKVDKELVEEVCLWPRLHQDIRAALEQGAYRGLNLGMVVEEAYRTRAGTRLNLDWLEVDLQEVVNKVLKRATELVTFVEGRLREKVYTNTEVIRVENCRRLLDLQSQTEKVVQHGWLSISSLHFKTFQNAAVFFEPKLDLRLDETDLRLQYRQFNKVLEEEAGRAKQSSTSLNILKLLLDPKEEKFKEIEGVLSILANAAICQGGVESVVESMVSVLEAHTPSVRGILNQERLENEVMVAWNGEDVFHCDSVVKEALKTYWEGKKDTKNWQGHFVRRSEDIQPHVHSQAIDSRLKKPVKLAVMTS